MNPAMFTSARQTWETPQDLFEALDREFHFTLDVCADPSNAKCRQYYTPQEDGLVQQWRGRCWMNPPYGKAIGQWMQKAVAESLLAAEVVVCLVPARTDTAWWHEYVMQGEVRFLRGRLRFVGARHGAPFPSAVVVLRNPNRGIE